MPVMSGFGALAELPWERINDKIERRVLAGEQAMIVWWKIKAGAHAGAHKHPHEQIVWMLNGRMEFRMGSDQRSMIADNVAVIPTTLSTKVFSRRIRRSLTSSRPLVKTSSLETLRLICVCRKPR